MTHDDIMRRRIGEAVTKDECWGYEFGCLCSRCCKRAGPVGTAAPISEVAPPASPPQEERP